MLRSPRETLASVTERPRTLDLGILIVVVSAVCSSAFLSTRVGQLAGLDQQVRQLESWGVAVDDHLYAQLRAMVPYRPVISAAIIVIGWPVAWLLLATGVKLIGGSVAGTGAGISTVHTVRFAQILTVIVHASSVFALRSVVAAPLNYARESMGGATSLAAALPAFGRTTFPGRLLGALDIFVLWWVILAAMGLGMLYETRSVSIARWLMAAYAAAAVVLVVTQVLRGGI